MAATLNASRSTMLTTQAAREQARDLTASLQGEWSGLRILSPGAPDDTLVIPQEVLAVMAEVVRAMAEGRSLTVSSMPEALTTTVAAEHLGISRPTLMKLIAENAIESFKVGTHTRITSAEVARYRRERTAKQRAAFEVLRDLEEEFDIQE